MKNRAGAVRYEAAPHRHFRAQNFQATSVQFSAGVLPHPRAEVRPLHNRSLPLSCARFRDR